MRSKKFMYLGLALSLSLFSVFSLGSGDDESDNGTVENVSSSDTTNDKKTKNSKKENKKENKKEVAEEPEEDVLKVGGTFKKDGLIFKFKDVVDNYYPSDDEYGFYKVGKKNKYVACTFFVKNKGDNDEYVSVYDFKCYADNKSCSQEFISTEDYDEKAEFINENLSSNRSVEFVVFFEVPKNAKNVQLEYETNMWTDEKLIIQVI